MIIFLLRRANVSEDTLEKLRSSIRRTSTERVQLVTRRELIAESKVSYLCDTVSKVSYLCDTVSKVSYL